MYFQKIIEITFNLYFLFNVHCLLFLKLQYINKKNVISLSLIFLLIEIIENYAFWLYLNLLIFLFPYTIFQPVETKAKHCSYIPD